MPLANLEHEFIQSLLQRQNSQGKFLSKLSTAGNMTPQRQLSIYKGNLDGAHQKTLSQIYPTCRNILGEAYFNQLCSQYRTRYPSTTPDLNYYGEHLTDFLRQLIKQQPTLDGFSYLPDLAMLEWSWHTSYFCADDPLFDYQQLAQLSAKQQHHISFQLSHSFSLHRSIYPIIEIWQANNDEPSAQQTFTMPAENIYFAVCRSNFAPKMAALTKAQYLLLTAIAAQHTLQQLSQRFNLQLQQQLQYFIRMGWITGWLEHA